MAHIGRLYISTQTGREIECIRHLSFIRNMNILLKPLCMVRETRSSALSCSHSLHIVYTHASRQESGYAIHTSYKTTMCPHIMPIKKIVQVLYTCARVLTGPVMFPPKITFSIAPKRPHRVLCCSLKHPSLSPPLGGCSLVDSTVPNIQLREPKGACRL